MDKSSCKHSSIFMGWWPGSALEIGQGAHSSGGELCVEPLHQKEPTDVVWASG